MFCSVFSLFFPLLDCTDWYQPIMGEIDIPKFITVLFTCKGQPAHNEAFWKDLNTALEIIGQRAETRRIQCWKLPNEERKASVT